MEVKRPYLTGKIQIVKIFVVPKFMSKASLIPISDDLIKEINKLIYNFIWQGNDKIKRTALTNDIEDGRTKNARYRVDDSS